MNEYLGIPFEDGGRDRCGCDCWGLVRLVLYEKHGVTVPAYGDIGVADLLHIARTMQQAVATGPWAEVKRDQLQAGDVVVLKNILKPVQFPCHVGIMIDGNKMLHTEFAAGAHIVLVDDKTVKDRIICYRRHKDLT